MCLSQMFSLLALSPPTSSAIGLSSFGALSTAIRMSGAGCWRVTGLVEPVFPLADDPEDLREIWTVPEEHFLHLVVVDFEWLEAIRCGRQSQAALLRRFIMCPSTTGSTCSLSLRTTSPNRTVFHPLRPKSGSLARWGLGRSRSRVGRAAVMLRIRFEEIRAPALKPVVPEQIVVDRVERGVEFFADRAGLGLEEPLKREVG